jgi:hypothetical protein
MAVTKIIRYTTKPECAAENERLIRAVFAELAQDDPGGLRYAAFRLADKVSFVHVAVLDDGDANPLTRSAAFAEFQRGIGARCAEGPVAADADLIGSYRLPLPASSEPHP